MIKFRVLNTVIYLLYSFFWLFGIISYKMVKKTTAHGILYDEIENAKYFVNAFYSLQ